MAKVKVNLKRQVNDSYEILIERGLFKKIPALLKAKPFGNRYLIITDSNIEELFGKKLLEALEEEGLKAGLVSFAAGEKSKGFETFSQLLEKCFQKGLDRNSCIIALGGGVAGDLAGFVAATYMRGINYIQVPTSLLAMVDSSIGGKTGIDLREGKNIVGNIKQPKAVFIDTALLESLDDRELKNGLAEVVKHAVIADKKFFEFLSKNMDCIKFLDEKALPKIVAESCKIKSAIVEKDEKEKNLRKTINFGHTIGHAIESLGKYEAFSHGHAVAIGMLVEGKIAVEMGILKHKEFAKINRLVQEIGFNLTLKQKPEEIIEKMKHDKKAVAGKIFMVLPSKIGSMKKIAGQYSIPVQEETVLKVLNEFVVK